MDADLHAILGYYLFSLPDRNTLRQLECDGIAARKHVQRAQRAEFLGLDLQIFLSMKHRLPQRLRKAVRQFIHTSRRLFVDAFGILERWALREAFEPFRVASTKD